MLELGKKQKQFPTLNLIWTTKMRDRNPALPSKVCPKCSKLGFRLYITTFFIQHYGGYCTECGYKTEPSPGEISGCVEWVNAGTSN